MVVAQCCGWDATGGAVQGLCCERMLVQVAMLHASQSVPWLSSCRRLQPACALLTCVSLLAMQVLTVATAPVAALLGGSVRQVGAMLVILVVGLLNVYIK